MPLGNNSTLADYNATLGNDAMLGNNGMLSNDAKLRNNGMLGDVGTLCFDNPMLGYEAKLRDDTTLGKDATLRDDATLGDNVTLAMAQCSSATGFDLISEKNCAVHRAINPGVFLSNADNLQQIAINAAAAVGRKVKSSFMEGLGKRKIVKVNGASSSPPCTFQSDQSARICRNTKNIPNSM
jgi:hypothetical protein